MLQRVVKIRALHRYYRVFREGEMLIVFTGGGRITGWTEGLRAFFSFLFFHSYIFLERRGRKSFNHFYMLSWGCNDSYTFCMCLLAALGIPSIRFLPQQHISFPSIRVPPMHLPVSHTRSCVSIIT